MDSNPSKAESIAQAAKAVYTELCKEFDEDTAKALLIASMSAICADVTRHVYIPSLSLGGVSDKPEVWGNTEPEMIVPIKNHGKYNPAEPDQAYIRHVTGVGELGKVSYKGE
ncbi:hypothetical protein [Paenibacillus lautus]|uniref:hypothetical protein n=1 Tax=Paenibacillus lautus TaxID=1401 RepID=UPI003D27C08A